MHVSSGRISPLPWCVPSYIFFLSSHMSRAVVGSQVKSLYRHGRMSECHDKMEDFKFCMSLKSMEPGAKREAWIRRRAEWWANRRLGKSSENVWDVRRYASDNTLIMSLIAPHTIIRESLSNWPPTLSDDAAQASGTIA